MKENFNTYIDHIEPDFWRELCVKEGKLRHYERGEEFAKVGEVARQIGYIKSGTLKYVAFSSDGTEHVIGLEFDEEFVSDFPFSLSGVKARVSIIAVTPCDIYCFPVQENRVKILGSQHLLRVMSEIIINFANSMIR